MNKFYCSPAVKPSKTGCFDRKSLINIANKYNEQSRDKIVYSSSSTDEQLWKLIDKKIQKHCNGGEICWLNNDFISNDKELSKYHLPLKPDGQYKWLKTSDINYVLNQYEDLYTDFTFMGSLPIDFDLVFREIAMINICKIIGQGKTRIAFVFNLDKHNQKGSHWVCMYVDFYLKNICYYDSYGISPPKEIDALMNKLVKQTLSCTGIKLDIKINKVRHQYKNSECGVYCLYFIYNFITGKSFEEISSKQISDDEVNKWRDFFFRPHSI